MARIRRNLIMAGLVLFSLFAVTACDSAEKSPDLSWEEDEKETKKTEAPKEKEVIRVEDIDFERISQDELQISWSDEKDPYVEKYRVFRQKVGAPSWEFVEEKVSNGTTEQIRLTVNDELVSNELQNYLYRVDVEVKDTDNYRAEKGKEIPVTNILICIDPGHYTGCNTVASEGVVYAEGDFTLEIAEELCRALKENYGISSKLTRTSEDIVIDGYKNQNLDQNHISLRGEMAVGADLFVSLHTNANQENVNGAPTTEQPISLNKPLVIVNRVAMQMPQMLQIANEVGNNIAQVSYEDGIASVQTFHNVESKEDVLEWTDAYNDQIDIEGTVCKRVGKQNDYYGVLRGAASIGVPGMIIEHGYHTVPQMRQLAVNGNLKIQWGEADARGIAKGFGLI